MYKNEEENGIMNIRIDNELRKKFKMKTINENTTMSEVLINYIKEYLKK